MEKLLLDGYVLKYLLVLVSVKYHVWPDTVAVLSSVHLHVVQTDTFFHSSWWSLLQFAVHFQYGLWCA